jgi:hypothetical protein
MEEKELSHDSAVIEDVKPTTLPTSYVMWLTMRSQFIDKLAETDTEIFHKWKEFEEYMIQNIERKYQQCQ